MVFVKVRETYDLATVKNKMTLIGVHTPKPDIIKRNFPGLLMQCKAYRPYSCDIRIACASVMPLDPLGVGTETGSVAPEDVFNPILYKTVTNLGMSQLEARINYLREVTTGVDVVGESAVVDADTVTGSTDEFNVYYGILSNAHGWKHANPQSGVMMNDVRPMVFEMLYNIGDNPELASPSQAPLATWNGVTGAGEKYQITAQGIKGNAKPMPFINCTSYSFVGSGTTPTGVAKAGFTAPSPDNIFNSELEVPYLPVMCAAVIVPPSKLHQLFYRMVVEWTLEFTGIRPLSEVMNFVDLANMGATSHYSNYSYSKVKEAVTGSEESILDNDAAMVSANVDVKKVM